MTPDRYAQEMAEMAANAAKLHAEIGTEPWDGLDNDAALPDVDWAPDTSALGEAARRALAAAPTPALTNWADVRRTTTDAEWNRILADLGPGPRGQRERAIEAAKQARP
jgi:hypothetical protein